MYQITNIDLDKRQILITKKGDIRKKFAEKEVYFSENDKIPFNFLPNTEDKFETELVLVEVEIFEDDKLTREYETKPFMRRVGTDILLSFDPNDYDIEGVL